jgi:hypothetical protein
MTPEDFLDQVDRPADLSRGFRLAREADIIQLEYVL